MKWFIYILCYNRRLLVCVYYWLVWGWGCGCGGVYKIVFKELVILNINVNEYILNNFVKDF